MTQEQKQLLLKDLCARLPYGVIVDNPNPSGGAWDEVISVDVSAKTVTLLYDGRVFSIDDVKPYLRSMSNMTDEEREEWADLFNLELDKLNEIDDENKAEELAPYYFGKSHQVSIDWLNSHHFDYRGLIPMGLALEAKEGMYES